MLMMLKVLHEVLLMLHCVRPITLLAHCHTDVLLFYTNKNHLLQLDNGHYNYKLKASPLLHTAKNAKSQQESDLT